LSDPVGNTGRRNAARTGRGSALGQPGGAAALAHSPECQAALKYQAALKVGEKFARYNIIAVNGVSQ
jgi:hypothetical protein